MALTRTRAGTSRSPRRRTPAAAVALAVLALVLTGCSWFGEDEGPAPVAEATPAPVEQADPDVEVIGAEGVEVGEPVDADDPGAGLYYVSSLYDLSGPPLAQPALVRMVLDSAVPAETPLAVATRADDDAPWSFLEARLDTDRRHVEFITSDLGTVGVLAVDSGSVARSLGSDVSTSLEDDAARPDGVSQPTCDATEAAEADGLAAKSWKRRTVLWCLDQLGDDHVLRLTNAVGVPVRVTAPGVLGRGESGDPSRRGVPYDAWVAAAGAGGGAGGDGTDTYLVPGSTLALDVDLEPGTTLLVTAADDDRTRSVQLLHALSRALTARVAAFGVVDKADAPTAGRVLRGWLAQPACAAALGGDARALVRGCLREKSLTKSLGSVSRLLVPGLAQRGTRAMLRERMVDLRERADRVEQRIEVTREDLDFGALVGSFAGTDRTLTVSADGLVTERFGRDGRRVLTLTYQLSDPDEKGTRATATLTAVEVLARDLIAGAVPQVGRTGTLRLERGVVTPPYLQTTYCDAARAAGGRCTDAPPAVTPEQEGGTRPAAGTRGGRAQPDR